MKELSVEEKAQAYDNALEIIIDYYQKTKYSSLNSASTDREVLEKAFPQLKEGEDENERIVKELLTFFRESIHGGHILTNKEYDSWIAWLEKQGEQKLIDKIQLGKKYKCIASPRYSTFMKGFIYIPQDKFLCSLMNFCSDCFELIEDGEQKPIDEAEPKFKVGDWIVSDVAHSDYRICKIIKIENGCYTIESTYGYKGYNIFEEFDNIYHLWSIKDAKCGDMLCDETTVFIFKDLLSDGSVMSYCDCDKDSGESDAFCPLSMNLMCSKITPATKGQRDLLFQKMKEAGYMWDADKKELKKVKKAPQKFMVGDTIRYKGTEYKITEVTSKGYKVYALTYDEDAVSLISFSASAILVEQKPTTWSEGDENDILFLTSIIEECFKDKEKITLCGDTACADFTKEDVIDRLKSLRPQNTWKPSDEQITWLYRAADDASKDSRMKQILNELLSDLKKLREG